MKLMAKLLLAASYIALANATFADITSATAAPTKGWYIGGNLGMGTTTCNNCSVNTITGAVDSTTGTTPNFDFLGGYQFNQYVAVEGGIGMAPLFPMKTTYNKTWGTDQGQHTSSKWAAVFHSYIAAKGMLPLTNRFGLFAKLGLDYEGIAYNQPFAGNNDDDNNGTSFGAAGFYQAVGASYNFMPELAGTVSYNHISTSHGDSKFDSSYGAVGVTYLF